MMEEAGQYKTQDAETEGEITPPPSVDDVDDLSLKKVDTQQRGASSTKKVWFGLIAVLAIAAIAVALGVLLFSKGDDDNEASDSVSNPSDRTSAPTLDRTSAPISDRTSAPTLDLSDMEAMAKVVLPGVDISDHLNQSTPQYRALEWLTYHDSRNLTIQDDSIELLERFSLATLYFARGEYGDGKEWLSSQSHCTWHWRTTCDENGRVVYLNFYDEQVPYWTDGVFRLPPEIGNFRNARSVDFMGNLWEGSIPTEIGLLTSVTSLTLSYNHFEGTLPTEILNLNDLNYLSVGSNQLVGTIPSEIGEMKQLQYLDFLENTVSGTLPTEIGKMKQLAHLDLRENNLSGTIPSEIGHLQQLTHLRLSRNIGLTGTVPMEVGQLELIRRAYFQSTSLTGGLDDLVFCKNQDSAYGFSLEADCEITCECCTKCCARNGTCVDI
eukprot:scaffold11230_cov109-Cylindrotheca_fusiformis.AAC.1